MAGEASIRLALKTDLPALVQIYNHYVEHTAVTFDTRSFDVDQRRAWFEGFTSDGTHRLFVADQDGQAVGYASSSSLIPRPAYDTSVQTTVYLHPSSTGKGIGSRLYTELMTQLVRDPRLHRAYGGIALPNESSVALHKKLGFEHIGTYREVGYKFDKFWDVAWYEKDLSS
ncbi:MAG: GNAT family N-acetyltransferase [Gammaproteobacteria bacterium]|nr:GNAT family N-acetyltransferase [Gammaproteobacteria bacterium]